MKTYLQTYKVRAKVNLRELPVTSTAQEAAVVVQAIFDSLDVDQEHFVVLALDNQHQVRGYKVVASGGMDFARIDPRLVFRAALLLGACEIIVAHNHPSGSADPSNEDYELTLELQEAGSLLAIPVVDHLIIGADEAYSFTRKSMLPLK